MPRQIIIKNQAKCKNCEDGIESKSRHDLVWCSCEVIAVHGGKDCLKRSGNIFYYEELSETIDIDDDAMNETVL